MRLCVGVSEDRESVFTYQYAEPALAFAAMSLTHTHGWSTLLDLLRDSMAATYTQAGHRGEIGAQTLLLMDADRCNVELYGDDLEPWRVRGNLRVISVTIPTIPLSKFLSILTGSDVHIYEDNFSNRISHMYVRLIQFVQVFAKPGKNQLCEMFKRAAGIVVKPGSKQVNLIIPVLVVGEGENVLDVIPVPEQMSAVLVQIKCYSSATSQAQEIFLSSANLVRDVSTENSDKGRLNDKLDYLSLLIEIGPISADSNRWSVFSRDVVAYHSLKGEVDKKQLSMSIWGLRPCTILRDEPPLRDTVNAAFDALMTESFKPEKIKGSSEAAIKNLKLSLGVVSNS